MFDRLIALEYNRNRLVIEAVKIRRLFSDPEEFQRVAAAVAGRGDTSDGD